MGPRVKNRRVAPLECRGSARIAADQRQFQRVGSLDFVRRSLWLRECSGYIQFLVIVPEYSSDKRRSLGSMHVLENPLLGLQVIAGLITINWDELGSYSIFALGLWIYLQLRPKHDFRRLFIHKTVRECDIIMHNCRLITPPHLFFCSSRAKQEKKTILQGLLHHFRR